MVLRHQKLENKADRARWGGFTGHGAWSGGRRVASGRLSPWLLPWVWSRVPWGVGSAVGGAMCVVGGAGGGGGGCRGGAAGGSRVPRAPLLFCAQLNAADCFTPRNLTQMYDQHVNLLCLRRVRARSGRLSALSVIHSKSILYGAFAWARRALNRPKRLFLARAGGEQGYARREQGRARQGDRGGVGYLGATRCIRDRQGC
jgi:hypothetical protein